MRHLNALLVATAIIALAPSAAYAQASLTAENTIESVRVQVTQADGSKRDEVFTLVRDARVPEQWYYLPNDPRLTETAQGGKRIPELSLIRYTAPKDDGTLRSGGLLTFAVSLGATAEAMTQLTNYLTKKMSSGDIASTGKSLRLSAVPLNSATAYLYSPKTGELIAEVEPNSVVTPTDANGKVVFAVLLTDVGADLYANLLNGTSGIPVSIKYNYNGMTPPVGFKVTANWDQIYSHYSKDEKLRARAAYYGWFSASYSEDKTYIRDELIKSGDIKVEPVTGENFTQSQLDSYLQPIIKRINDQMLEDLQPPKQIDPASAGTPGSGGFFGGVGYSVAIKDAKYVKKGSETWDFRFSTVLERASGANGVVSLAGFPPDVRNDVITTLDAGNWKRVYFAMPAVPANLDSAQLHLQLQPGPISGGDQYFRWSAKDNGWVSAQGARAANGAWVSLLSAGNVDPAKLVWQSYYQFATGPYSLTARLDQPLNPQTGGVSAPSDLMRVIEVAADEMTFSASDPANRLLSVDVRLTDGTRTASKTFRRTGPGQVTAPLLWPVAYRVGGPSVEAQFRFNYSSGKQCARDFSPSEFDDRFIAGSVDIGAITPVACP